MNSAHMIHTEKQKKPSIDDLESYLKSLCEHMGFIRSSDLNIINPDFLHYEDALEILKWKFIQRGFYAGSGN